MKVEVTKTDSGKRQINIAVSGDIVKNKFEDVFKKIAKEAKVPGFRPGNAPRDMLEKLYSANVNEQVLKELIPELYDQAVQKEKIEAVELPEISDVKLDRASLSFKATVEVRPEIKLKNYKGLKIKYKKIQATPDDLKRNLDSLRESRKIEVIDDNFAKGLGYPNTAELEKAVERQFVSQEETRQRQKIEHDIIEQLTKDLDFKLPQAMVNRQLEDSVRQAKIDLALRGLARDKVEEQDKTLVKELEPQARNQVKVYLVLEEIARKENITIDDHMPRHVIEFLLRQAEWLEEA